MKLLAIAALALLAGSAAHAQSIYSPAQNATPNFYVVQQPPVQSNDWRQYAPSPSIHLQPLQYQPQMQSQPSRICRMVGNFMMCQ